MGGGQLGVLHTYSAYAPDMPALPLRTEDMRMHLLELQIAALEDKETAFAQKFGYGSIKELIEGVKKILNQSPKDLEALRQFSSTNLRRHLQQFRGKYGKGLEGQKIILTFEAADKSDDYLNEILESINGSNGDFTWETKSRVAFHLDWDTRNVKTIINKMQGTHFKTENDNIEYLRKYIQANSGTLIDVKEGKGKTSLNTFIINNKLDPFKLKKEEIQELAKNNRPLLEEYERRIKDFILDGLCAGASGEFKSAVQTIMQQKMPQLTDISFLMGGDSTNNVVGAFGELQTAIMFQYIANKTPNKIAATRISTILGDVLNGYSQQMHTDLEIFNAFGIQVKNYSGAYSGKTERTVTVHLHPSEIEAFGISTGVVDYIVNSYFNTSIPKYSTDELSDFFKSHASELLNLDLSPQIPDQVCFYMIGSNFIPGSVLLRQAFVELTLKVSTTISGASGGNDITYSMSETGDDWHRVFRKWWKSNNYSHLVPGDFSPTDKNSIDAWDRNVSIATSFTYSALYGGEYDLFK